MITLPSSTPVSGIAGFFAGGCAAYLLSGIILTCCIRWAIFIKAGEPGWKALIPFNSSYLYYDIVWKGQLYLIILVGTLLSTTVGCLISLIDPVSGFAVALIPGLAFSAMSMITGLILPFRYAQAFGKSDGFAIGLLLLPPVFQLLLAFGSCRYMGHPDDRSPEYAPPVRPPIRYTIPPRPIETVPVSPSKIEPYPDTFWD